MQISYICLPFLSEKEPGIQSGHTVAPDLLSVEDPASQEEQVPEPAMKKIINHLGGSLLKISKT